MPKRLFVFLLIFTLLLSGCSSSSVGSSSVSPDNVGISVDVCSDISSLIERSVSSDVAQDLKGVAVLDSKKEGSVTVSISLYRMPSGDGVSNKTNIEYQNKLFSEDAQELVKIILQVLDEKEVPFSSISLLAKNEKDPDDPDGIISWETKDGKTGIYVNNTSGQQILLTDVALADIPGSVKDDEFEDAETLGFTASELLEALNNNSDRSYSIVSDELKDGLQVTVIRDSMRHCEITGYSSGDSAASVVLLTTKAQNGTVKATWESAYKDVQKLAGKTYKTDSYESGELLVYAVFAKGTSLDYKALAD